MKKTDKLKRYITNKRETKGITLIALVITIVLKRWCVGRYEKCRV